MAIDASDNFYSDGRITLSPGSDVATGEFTAWAFALLPLDMIFTAAGVTVVREVISDTQVRLGAPWALPTQTSIPYFALRWTAHTDPRNYGPRLATYLSRISEPPNNRAARDIIDIRDLGAKGTPETDRDAILKAVAQAPVGGGVYFPGGEWYSPDIILRDDISYIGGGMPTLASDGRSLQGGTVIKGRLLLAGSRVTAQDFGVDAGMDYVLAHKGGVAEDGFVMHGETLGAIKSGCVVRNIAGLCKDLVSPFHGVLLEGLTASVIDNVWGGFGYFGVVVKASHSKASKLYGYKNSNSGVIIKSDSYAPCNNLDVSDVGAQGVAATEGCVVIHAATEDMFSVSVRGIKTNGGKVGLLPMCSVRAEPGGKVISGLSIDDVNSEGASDCGVRTHGAIVRSALKSLTVTGVASDQCVQVGADAYGVDLDGVYVSTSEFKADAISLAGAGTWTNLTAVVVDDLSQLSGITLASGSARRSLQAYRGRLNLNGDASGLVNDWTSMPGSVVQSKLSNGVVALSGMIVPPGVRTGSNNSCYILLAPPPTDRKTMATGFDATGKGYPLLLTVAAAGIMYFDLFTPAGASSGAFPADIGLVALDGISYEVA